MLRAACGVLKAGSRKEAASTPALPSPSRVTLGGHPTSLGSYLISSAEKVLKPSLRLRQARLECRPCLSFQPESQDGGRAQRKWECMETGCGVQGGPRLLCEMSRALEQNIKKETPPEGCDRNGPGGEVSGEERPHSQVALSTSCPPKPLDSISADRA